MLTTSYSAAICGASSGNRPRWAWSTQPRRAASSMLSARSTTSKRALGQTPRATRLKCPCPPPTSSQRRRLGVAGDEGGPRRVLVRAGGAEQLHLLLADTVVEVAVVEVETLDGQPRVLEDVAAAAALVEREPPRLVLQHVAGAHPLDQVASRAGRARREARLEQVVDPGGQPVVVPGAPQGDGLGAVRRFRAPGAGRPRARPPRSPTARAGAWPGLGGGTACRPWRSAVAARRRPPLPAPTDARTRRARPAPRPTPPAGSG